MRRRIVSLISVTAVCSPVIACRQFSTSVFQSRVMAFLNLLEQLLAARLELCHVLFVSASTLDAAVFVQVVRFPQVGGAGASRFVAAALIALLDGGQGLLATAFAGAALLR